MVEKQLLVCKGKCREVFHLDCAAKKDVSVRDEDFNRRKYQCKTCFYVETGRKKPGRKSRQQIEDERQQLELELKRAEASGTDEDDDDPSNY